MTELLAVRPGDRVLELGTGSGYQAAILAALGADVTSLERHATLAEQARDRIASMDLPGRVEIRVGGRQPRGPGRCAVRRDHRDRGRPERSRSSCANSSPTAAAS